MIDLIGIGALNLDIVVSGSASTRLSSEAAAEIAARFEPGGEKPGSRAEVMRLLELVGQDVRVQLGGSAFNLVHAVAALEQGVRLGYVGSLGTSRGGLDFEPPSFEE